LIGLYLEDLVDLHIKIIPIKLYKGK